MPVPCIYQWYTGRRSFLWGNEESRKPDARNQSGGLTGGKRSAQRNRCICKGYACNGSAERKRSDFWYIHLLYFKELRVGNKQRFCEADGR